MLLCEFSSPLFLDPAAVAGRGEGERRETESGKDWQTRNDAQVGGGNI